MCCIRRAQSASNAPPQRLPREGLSMSAPRWSVVVVSSRSRHASVTVLSTRSNRSELQHHQLGKVSSRLGSCAFVTAASSAVRHSARSRFHFDRIQTSLRLILPPCKCGCATACVPNSNNRVWLSRPTLFATDLISLITSFCSAQIAGPGVRTSPLGT